ncbi:uncharacterized protein HGUI_00407 [Hanseniaspora guilliermondii]|uniref:FAS1 domain-containing protein n=1 Tax=Hanseniaspora guilliermondii TaxID=56406 RepID=A0A1L0CTZ7_9ASCO|nr:uncharacterized protein HGUI_00407 [Hanseniaspora guilliermondii]
MQIDMLFIILIFYVYSIQGIEEAKNNVLVSKHKEKDLLRTRYTTVVDVLADNIDKFNNILNFFREADLINFLNEINSTEFTLLIPNDNYFTEWDESLLGSFDVNKSIIFDRLIDLKTNFSSSVDSLMISWGYYPLVFETFNGKVSYYQQGHMLDDFSYDIDDKRGEVINLGSDLINRPTEQDCQIYETTHLLPLEKLKINDFLYAYSKKDVTTNYLSNLLQFYETDFQYLRSFINNTFIVTKDDNIEKLFDYDMIKLKYIFGTDPEVFATEFDFDDTIKSELIKDQKNFLNGTIIKGLLGPGLDAGGQIETLNGHSPYSLQYKVEDGGYKISINDFISESSPNIVSFRDLEDLENHHGERYGLSYIFNSFEVDISHINFTMQKYLIGLNAYDFLQEMHFRDLSYLLATKNNSTLFIYVDEYLNTANGFSYEGFSKKNLIYHFTEQIIDIENDFRNTEKAQTFHTDSFSNTKSILYNSMLCNFNKIMGKHCQKLKIMKTENDQYFINTLYSYQILNARDPISVGNSYIYIISEPLELPGSIIQSVGKELIHSSQSLLFLQNLNLLNLPLNTNGYTIFLPSDNAWQAMDLNIEYLKKNISVLNKFLKSYILEGLIYSDIKTTGKYYNLEGEPFIVSRIREDDNSVELISNKQDVLVHKGHDILFEQGVIHPIDSLSYPPDIQITLLDLMQTTGSGLDFMIFLGEISELKELVTSNQNYSFIVPTSSAMLKDDQFNVNSTDFIDLMKLHIIDSNSTALMKNCTGVETQISTLLDNTVVYCKAIEIANKPPALFLILKNKQGDEKKIRVLQQGCQTGNVDSCIYIVDDPVSLKWIKSNTLLELHMNLSWQSFVMGLVVGIFALLGGQTFKVLLKNYRKELSALEADEYEPVGNGTIRSSSHTINGSSINCNPSQHSLLYDENNQLVGAKYGSIAQPPGGSIQQQPGLSAGNFEAGYSENSQSRPISVQKQKSQLFATEF